MALDKLVDSTQLDADLASVANAIRTKGGTSASLAFPADFVSAIADIPSGGGGGATAETGEVTLTSDLALQATSTGNVFPGIQLSFEPDFFFMTMKRDSWLDIADPANGLYGLIFIRKAFIPPQRIANNVSTESLSTNYYVMAFTTTMGSSDVSNGKVITLAVLNTPFVERYHFDQDGHLYVGRYSSASTYAFAGTYRYFAMKI